MSTQVAVRTEINLKRLALQKARIQGITLSFVINRFLKDYVEEDYQVLLKKKNEDEVTCDELFFDRDIVSAANKLAEYVRNNPRRKSIHGK